VTESRTVQWLLDPPRGSSQTLPPNQRHEVPHVVVSVAGLRLTECSKCRVPDLRNYRDILASRKATQDDSRGAVHPFTEPESPRRAAGSGDDHEDSN
jgi:hypothetical protein